MSDSSTHLKTFKYRVYPTPAQEKCLFNTLEVCRHCYNMCLAERKRAYQLERHKSHFHCVRCGFKAHADANVAINIRDTYILSTTPQATVEQATDANTDKNKTRANPTISASSGGVTGARRGSPGTTTGYGKSRSWMESVMS